MATQTSNLGLTKPAYSETADIADINNNMDKVDAAVHGVQNGMAILANGNVHSAVTSGQYVYVRNHGTLAEGLYTATTNISTNATLSTSNLTAVPNNGALNTLRDDVTSLNSNLNGLYFSPYSVSRNINFTAYDAELSYKNDNNYRSFIITFADMFGVINVIGWDSTQTSVSVYNIGNAPQLNMTIAKRTDGDQVVLTFTRSGGNAPLSVVSLFNGHTFNMNLRAIEKS